MLYQIFLIFCAFLPFQFALNPTEGVDLAIVRIAIPLLFLAAIFFVLKNKGWNIFKNKISYLLLAFLLLAVFSLSFSHNLLWSLRKLLFLFSVVPIYFATIHILDTKQKQRAAIIFLVLGASLAAFVGIVQFLAQFVFGINPVYNFMAKNLAPFFLGNSFSGAVLAYPSWLVASEGATYMRAISVFPDPHMFAYYLEMLLPFSIALLATTNKHKKLFFASSVALIIVDIFTFTRGSYVAIIAAAFLILPIVPKNAVKKLLVGIAVFVFIFIFSPHNPVSGRFMSSFDVQEGSNQGRIANWKQGLDIVLQNPLGKGIGMYSLTINPDAKYREPIYAHNLYLDIAAELGVVSAFIFVVILFFALKNFWLASKKDSFFIAGVASLAAFSVHSLVETPLYSVHILTLFLIIVALSILAKKYAQNPND